MTIKETIKELRGLLENAFEVQEEKYIDVFQTAITFMEQMDGICRVSKMYEAKLMEVMGNEAFWKYIIQTAKDMYMDEINGMPEGEFKAFAKEHFDEITGTDPDEERHDYRDIDQIRLVFEEGSLIGWYRPDADE